MTPIEQILGRMCIYKEKIPFDKCRECTGYRSYAKTIECFDYTPLPRIEPIKIETIRELNDQEVWGER